MASSGLSWESEKKKGNQYYKNGQFHEAIVAWNLALDSLSLVSKNNQLPSVPPQQVDRDQQARDLAGAALNRNSTGVARLLSSNAPAHEMSETDKMKSIILANMAQAKIQMKDSTGAIRDCTQALQLDNTNTKALVRRGLALEELGKWKAALQDMEQAMKVPLPPSLTKVVGQTRSRLVTNMKNDQSLLEKCKDQNTLVNKDQTLRLHLHNSPPKVIQSGESFRVDCNVANEFGLWRPRDFESMCPSSRWFPLIVKLRPYRSLVSNTINTSHISIKQLESESSSSSASNAAFSSISLTSSKVTETVANEQEEGVSSTTSAEGVSTEKKTSLTGTKQSNDEFNQFKLETEKMYQNVIWMSESAQASMEVCITAEASTSVFIEISPLFFDESKSRPVMPVLSLPIVIQMNSFKEVNADLSLSSPAMDEVRDEVIISEDSFAAWSKIGAHCCRVSSISLPPNSEQHKSSSSNNTSEGNIDVVVAESPGHLGIGGKVWDAALVLLHYLCKEQHLIKGKSVVELGAGTGLVGIACHKLGARKMFITDLSEVCDLISVNIELNISSTLHPSNISSTNESPKMEIEAVPIGWSDPAPPIPSQLILQINNDQQKERSLHSSSSFQLDIDTIVLSDVVYDPELYLPLVATLRSLAPPLTELSTTSSVPNNLQYEGEEGEQAGTSKCTSVSVNKPVDIVLAHRHRNPMDPQFWAALKCAGFSVRQIDLKAMGLSNVVMGGSAAGDVNVFRLEREGVGGTQEEIKAAVAAAVPQMPSNRK